MTFRRSFSGKNRPCRLSGWLVAAVCAVVAGASSAEAARVNGTLVAYEGPAQQSDRYLHFQNQVTGDCYMVATATDGAFGAQLPPGVYDLRAERGAILARTIIVGSADVGLGRVSELAPYAPARIWQFQGIAPSLLSSAAPSTANILTVDTTVLPPEAKVMAAPPPDLSSPAPQLSEPAFSPPPPLNPPPATDLR